ncbi:LLM class flavin-dependent oxidoreductase [Actinomycetospora corticicola]|uniref:Alkanesulfonate monooxygenase SsuD/methylene tetrahydromethanopterin reductase-like flavin-dependent oxidoreductase (Luciferase family) n=1 Tax=Actinomycetospora corticicola TaxID=663602 RepID=A0A7Y9DY29_9PSEU|nr:LLM class flavin-dependent oxidoreductase [Actinomycetospora corticicola]NYD37456.1 alkanesulfonate monooxygenase SsuD/methylene tetrahydromethanopterin reductase-like flavin-dependent oxidoreductase (luciferase family) [Actinomycetospora corticicola]
MSTTTAEAEPTATEHGNLRDSSSALKLGVFSFNVSGGLNPSTRPRRYHVGWEHTSAIARRAEDMGFEFVLPVAKWRGYGGETDFYGESYETLTWAAGIAAQTSRITVGATVHTPVIHPTFVAKAGATVDAISDGRLALNVVMGWYPLEIGQFGLTPADHDIRYEHGDEWVTLLKRLWQEDEPFDFDGRWSSAWSALSKPKPIRRPLLMNAGTSPAGVDFTARQCDVTLASRNALEGADAFVAGIKSTAREKYARDLQVINVAHVICADTEAEAWRKRDLLLESGDQVATDNFMRSLGIGSQSFEETLKLYREYFYTSGAALPLIGTPEQIAEQMVAASTAGFDGLALGFFDFLDEMAAFDEQVMPLLREAGIHS